MIVTLQAGDGSGNTAVVNSSGHVVADIGNTVSVSVPGTVTTRRRTVTLERTLASIGTSSAEALDTRPNRCGLWAQNKSSTKTAYIRFGSSSATTDDWKIPPGGEFRAEGLQCESEVQAIASDTDTVVLFLELVEEP